MLLTNSQYEHLMSHYYHQQLKDNFILKKRMKEVYDAIPQMNELENRYTFGAARCLSFERTNRFD